MKNIKTLFFASLVIALISCEVDNYDEPNASISGSIKDIGAPGVSVQQDISGGSVITYREQGWNNKLFNQSMIFKCDGTYRNDLIFAATYDFLMRDGNYVPLDTIKNVVIKPGVNAYDFTVQPYIRIQDVSIQKVGTEIIATFKINPTVNVNVKEINLYVHFNPSVGFNINYGKLTVTQNVGSIVPVGTPFTLRLNLSSPDAISTLKSGEQYYFRVGALIDVAQAKRNYAPAVKIQI